MEATMRNNIHPTITSEDVRQDPTPGPWVERDCEIQAADGSAICEMLTRPEDKEKWGYHHADANSRLICAAPDLLAVVERLQEWAESKTSDWFYDLQANNVHQAPNLSEIIQAANEAVAEAKGGE
jgi:hypothetical protein